MNEPQRWRRERVAVALTAMAVMGAILAAGAPRVINEGQRTGTTAAASSRAVTNAEHAALTHALTIAANAHRSAENHRSSAHVSTEVHTSAKGARRQRKAHATRNASPSHSSRGAINPGPVTVATAARSTPTRPTPRSSTALPSTANAEFGFEG
jgi:hypothetical protein